MRKAQLQKIWKQLDGACEAIERLEENNITYPFIDLSAIVSLKNTVEEMIEKKTRK
jgi:hypothetical protein